MSPLAAPPTISGAPRVVPPRPLRNQFQPSGTIASWASFWEVARGRLARRSNTAGRRAEQATGRAIPGRPPARQPRALRSRSPRAESRPTRAVFGTNCKDGATRADAPVDSGLLAIVPLERNYRGIGRGRMGPPEGRAERGLASGRRADGECRARATSRLRVGGKRDRSTAEPVARPSARAQRSGRLVRPRLLESGPHDDFEAGRACNLRNLRKRG